MRIILFNSRLIRRFMDKNFIIYKPDSFNKGIEIINDEGDIDHD